MKNINEELNRMLYLTQHKRGQVISEQTYRNKTGHLDPSKRNYDNIGVFDAKGGRKGTVTMLGKGAGKEELAKNVGFKGEEFYLYFHTELIKNLGEVTPGDSGNETPPEVIPTVPQLKFVGDELPYPDNFINPQFDLYPGSENKINDYVTTISVIIKEYGGLNDNNTIKIFESIKDKNGKTIFIKGTADSFKPNFNVPNEMKNKGANKIDHDYGGKKDPAEMNLYLAEQRAIKFGEILAEKFSKETGIPKNIFLMYMDFSGYSYYGTGTKGVKSIEVKINYKIPAGKPIKKPGETTPGTEGKVVPPTENTFDMDLNGEMVKVVTITDADGFTSNAIPYKTGVELYNNKKIQFYDTNHTFNDKQNVDFKISRYNGEISLGGVNFGKLVTPDKAYKNMGGVSYVSDPGVYSLTNMTFKNRTLIGICKLFLVLNKY